MDKDIRRNKILHLPITVLSWVGLVHFEDAIFPWFNYFKGYFVAVMYVIYNILQLIFVVLNFTDINTVVLNSGTTALILCLYIKCWNYIIRRKQFARMFKNIHNNMKRIELYGEDGEQEILEKTSKDLSRILWCLQAMASFTCSTFLLYYIAIFFIVYKPGEEIHPLSVECWFPFKNEDHRVFVFIFHAYYISMNSMMTPELNAMIIALLGYAPIMLKLLQHKVRNSDIFILRTRKDNKHAEVTHEERFEFLIGCIEEQLGIIRYLEELKGMIAIPMAVDFIIFVLILCGEAVTSSQMSFGLELVFSVGYFLTILLMGLLYYWHANEITLQGEELATAVYECPWWDESISYRRAVILMIQRSHRSFAMTAGLFPMDLDTYIKILQVSYSTFTIMSQFN